MSETETELRWSIRHDRALLALLEEDSIQEASLTARVSRAAITRWLKHPVFRARLEKAREELFNAAKSRLMGAASEAVGTLQIVMRDEKAPYTAKVAAACALVPTVNPEHITPHSEAFQAVVWHLLVSHPRLKAKPTKWESIQIGRAHV